MPVLYPPEPSWEGKSQESTLEAQKALRLWGNRHPGEEACAARHPAALDLVNQDSADTQENSPPVGSWGSDSVFTGPCE